MLKALTRFFSLLFHPLLSAAYLYLLILFGRERLELTSLTDAGKIQIILLVLVLTFILPFILLLTCRFSGIIKNLAFIQREERYIPGGLMMLAYGLTAWFFEFRLHLPHWLSEPMFIMFGASIVFLLINIFEKISVYAWGTSLFVGLLAWLTFDTKDRPSLLLLVLSVILSGAVMSARIYCERHTARQLYAGSFVGILVGLSVAYLVFKQ